LDGFLLGCLTGLFVGFAGFFTGAAGLGAAGLGAAGLGSTGFGMAGTGAAGFGMAGTGAAGFKMAGTGATGFKMAGTGATGLGTTGLNGIGLDGCPIVLLVSNNRTIGENHKSVFFDPFPFPDFIIAPSSFSDFVQK